VQPVREAAEEVAGVIEQAFVVVVVTGEAGHPARVRVTEEARLARLALKSATGKDGVSLRPGQPFAVLERDVLAYGRNLRDAAAPNEARSSLRHRSPVGENDGKV
jgi:hypothetical protein